MKKVTLSMLLLVLPTIATANAPAKPANEVPHVLYYMSKQGIVSMQEFNSLKTCKIVSSTLQTEAYLKDVSPILNACEPK